MAGATTVAGFSAALFVDGASSFDEGTLTVDFNTVSPLFPVPLTYDGSFLAAAPAAAAFSASSFARFSSSALILASLYSLMISAFVLSLMDAASFGALLLTFSI